MTVEECERALAERGGRQGAVLVSRATVGLAAALRALRLPRGSGVMMPVMLCANVVHAVRGAGLEPVFVEMEAGACGFGMDLAKAERVMSERSDVSALLAVPLFGAGPDSEGLAAFAERHKLQVVVDAAQYGMRTVDLPINGRQAVAVYSFGAGKIGDAGGGAAVVGDDPGLLEVVRAELGAKRDLSETAGRIMKSLEGLDAELAGRRRLAEAYRDGLRVDGVTHPRGELPLWKYSVLLRDRGERDRVTRRLLKMGVEVTNLYMPLSRWFGPYREKGWGREEFPVAWEISERIINLPLWPAREGLPEEAVWAFHAPTTTSAKGALGSGR
jgi:dTDP-4-amino-4,6-dideoxygalactose transaminase